MSSETPKASDLLIDLKEIRDLCDRHHYYGLRNRIDAVIARIDQPAPASTSGNAIADKMMTALLAERDTLRAECERLRTTVEATEAQRNLRLKQRDAAETDLATLRGLAQAVVGSKNERNTLGLGCAGLALPITALAAWLEEHK